MNRRSEIIRVAQRMGFRVELLPGGHLRATAPSGARVIAGATPSSRRSLRNNLAQLRRALRGDNG